MKHILSLLLSIIALSAFAQDMSVRSMRMEPMDLTAATNQRLDLNGVPCALVKVQMPAGAVFEGNVIEPVEYRAGEYRVYMTANSKMLRVLHESAKPLMVTFANHDVAPLQSKATYILDITMPQATPQSAAASHNYLVLKVSPADAKVTLDGELQELHEGTLRMLLRRNTSHSYLVEAPGYFPEQGTVSIGSEKVERTISLRSRKGTLAVSATTAGTDIYINGEKTATGSWRGELMPGDYLVEGRLAGHRPAEQLATVASGEQTSVTIPALAAITGSLNVDFRPDGAAIAIDGTPRGTTPNVLDGIPVGTHSVTISAPGHATLTRDITITDSSLATLSGSLDPVATPTAAAPTPAPAHALPTAEAPQAASAFSTSPIHLALCATAPDGRTVYITAAQWQNLPASDQARYEKKGVCLSASGETFLVELHDKENGKKMKWKKAMKYNLPTKEQCQVLVDNKDPLNNALTVFRGTVMDLWYWTKTEYNSSYAWLVGMGNGAVNGINKNYTYRVRAVAPVPVAAM